MLAHVSQGPFVGMLTWVFWLLASMSVGAIIGALLLDDDFAISFVGIIIGGFTFMCLSLWRDW
jgi:hypothetical protein